MKKHILPIALFLLSLFSLHAQNNNTEPVRFGIRAGVTISHINFAKGSPPPEIPIETSWNQGPSIGVLMIVPLPFAKNLYLQPEYLYSQRGGEAKVTGVNYKFDYFSLPLHLRWEMSRRLSLLAGPQLALLINSREEVANTAASREVPIEERSLSASLGLEFDFWKSFALGARYMHGLNHIGLGDQLTVQEFKYEMFQVSAVYTF